MAGEARRGEEEQEQRRQLVSAQTRIWNLSLSYLKSMSLMTAVQLRIPDAVHRHGAPIPVSALATAVGIPDRNVPALARLMRSLARCGLFRLRREEGERELYSPTILSQQLLRDGATTAEPFTRFLVHPMLVTPWFSVAPWFLGDGTPGARTAFEVAHGEPFFRLLGRMPEYGEVFDGAMACDSRWSVGLLAREHPEVFRGLDSLVDVGGGDGTAAMAIKEVFPEMKCTVLELPHVAAAAASPAVVGVDFVEGDMFRQVPPADGVLLKWVLHDYDDEDCLRILERCKEAILPARERGGRVIIVETVMMEMDGGGDDADLEAQHHMDLLMLSVTGGRERNESEWRRILAAAGFGRCRVTPALGPIKSVIEAYP